MNKRIREFFEQAALETNEDPNDEHPIHMMARFAELIVLECSSICYKALENGDEAAILLMNTFGVEE